MDFFNRIVNNYGFFLSYFRGKKDEDEEKESEEFHTPNQSFEIGSICETSGFASHLNNENDDNGPALHHGDSTITVSIENAIIPAEAHKKLSNNDTENESPEAAPVELPLDDPSETQHPSDDQPEEIQNNDTADSPESAPPEIHVDVPAEPLVDQKAEDIQNNDDTKEDSFAAESAPVKVPLGDPSETQPPVDDQVKDAQNNNTLNDFEEIDTATNHGSHDIISNQDLTLDIAQECIHDNGRNVVISNTSIRNFDGSILTILQLFQYLLIHFPHLENCIIDCSRFQYSNTIISELGKELSNNFTHLRAIHFYGLQNFNLLKLYAFIKENTGTRLKFDFEKDFVLPDELKRDLSVFFYNIRTKPEGQKPEVIIPGYDGAEYLKYVEYYREINDL